MGIFSKNPQISYHINMSRKVSYKSVRFTNYSAKFNSRSHKLTLCQMVVYYELVHHGVSGYRFKTSTLATNYERLHNFHLTSYSDDSW